MEYKFTHSFDDKLLQQIIPPSERHLDPGDGDFNLIGKHFASLFLDLNLVNKDSVVLDIGCNVGRIAIPLTQILTSGYYYGFDVVKNAIDLCQQTITPKFDNFEFEYLDVQNDNYNPNGSLDAKTIKFPYVDNTFDFVFLVSVFTHMHKAEIENYTKEIKRVLKKKGKAFITYFIINDKTLEAISQNRADRSFSPEQSDENLGAVGISEKEIRETMKKNKLNVLDINLGWWSNQENPLTYQDVVIVQKI